MRRELLWTLGGTVVLSAAAVWWPQPAPKVVGAVEAGSGAPAEERRDQADVSALKEPLPRTLEPLQLESARRDPFTPVVAAAPAAAVASPPRPVVVQTPVAPEAPVAPPLTLRYLGRMVTPDGRPMVLLARGDAAVPVQAGIVLDEGYRVLRITSEAVRLVYPPTGGEVDIPIPPAPNNP